MKITVIILVIFLLLITACSRQELTGNVIGSDSCRSLKDVAKDDCYFESGQCSKIQKESVRNVCVAELGIKKSDLAVCNLVTSESAKGYCQSSIASKSNDVEICKAIPDDYWKDNCHFRYAVDNKQSLFCAAINALEQQQDCFFKVAIDTNNPEYCSSLPENRANECLFTIAMATKNIALCESLSHPLSIDACQLKLASRILMDPALCNQIKTKDLRLICQERFAETKVTV